MYECQLDDAGWAVALLGNDDFSEAFEVGIVFLVNLFAEDERHEVSILLDRTRLAQIGELRAMVAAAAFGCAAQLREGNHRNLQFLGNSLQATRDGRDFLGAVLEALAAYRHSRHELQVIDDQQVKSVLIFEAARLRTHFNDRYTRRVIDVEARLHQALGRTGQLVFVFAGDEAGAEAVRVYPRVRRQHTHQKRFFRHFERKYADYLVAQYRSVLGNVHGQRCLTHGRAGSNDDKVRRLQAAGHLVQQGVVGGKPSNFLSASIEFVERAEGITDDRRNVGEAFAQSVLGEGEDLLFGKVDDIFGILGVLDSTSDSVLSKGDQATQHRLVAHDANIMLDTGPLGYAIDERRKIGNATDCLDFLATVEFFSQRDHVDGTAGILQITHARKDTAMSVEGEIVGLEFRCLIE